MKKILKLLMVLFFLALSAILLTGFFIARSSRSKVAELRQEIQTQGDPLYFSDLTPESVNVKGNAFIPLMEAEEELSEFRFYYRDNFDFDTPNELSAEQLKALVKKVEESAELYRQIDEILACTELEAEIDYSAGLDASLEYVSVLRAANDAIQARTISYVSQNRGDEALRSCLDGMRISRLLKDDHNLVGLLISVAIQQTMSDDAFYVLTTCPTSPEARDELVQELSLADFKKSLLVAFKGERSLGVQTFRDLREGKGQFANDIKPRFQTGLGFWGAYVNNDEATYIQLMNRIIASVDQSHVKRKQLAEEITAKLDGGFGQIVTKLILPSVLSVSESVDAVDAKIRSLQVICRSLTEGEDILKDLPNDPFNDQTLTATKTPAGWIVYSVGLNLQDDGGDLGTPDQNVREIPDIGYGPLPSTLSPVTSADPEATN
ncbi:MAG: hypothetical protein P8L85_17050 [Rubripirellula sp.]|nr:hypothetical protein [Rubripirellula sp.]